MTIRYELQTGWPSNLDTIRYRIGAFRRYSYFKIGITSDPSRRASGYRHEYPLYNEMIVLYMTSSIENVRNLEEELVDYYRGRFDRCDNINRGGGGRIGVPPFFLYIVRHPSEVWE